jgi:hypothetical protein
VAVVVGSGTIWCVTLWFVFHRILDRLTCLYAVPRQAVADPQAYAKRKEKRGEMKRENKKRRVKSFA